MCMLRLSVINLIKKTLYPERISSHKTLDQLNVTNLSQVRRTHDLLQHRKPEAAHVSHLCWLRLLVTSSFRPSLQRRKQGNRVKCDTFLTLEKGYSRNPSANGRSPLDRRGWVGVLERSCSILLSSKTNQTLKCVLPRSPSAHTDRLRTG